MIFSILGVYPPKGKQWKIGRDAIDKFEGRGDLFLENNKPYVKMRLDDERNEITEPFWAFFDKTIGTAESAKSELSDIIENHGFETVKPISLIKKLTIHATNKSAIILDFFAGSSTTAHAVMQLNSEDGGNRQFIMVQLPEPTDEKSEAYKAGFANIAEIGKERIRRAGAKIKADNPDKSIDTGFKVFKLAQSNFKQWQNITSDSTAEQLQEQLEIFTNPLTDNADDISIVYELLLRLGLKLTVKIQQEHGVYWLIDNQTNKKYALILQPINHDSFMNIIKQKPNKTIALDRVFNNDSLKANIALQFKDANLEFESI